MTFIKFQDYNDYDLIRFPGGELHVRLKNPQNINKFEPVKILARLYKAEDIIELRLLMDAVDGVVLSTVNKKVLLPYLPYARADRRFVDGDCYGLHTFYKILVYSSDGWSFDTLDVHSPNPYARNVDPSKIVETAVRHFADRQISKVVTILYPDKGAAQRYDIKSINGLAIQTLYCEKKRDPATGKLSDFVVPNHNEFYDERTHSVTPTIIVDDICDGGGTFLGIADKLNLSPGILGLYVTHGIFSKGLEELRKRFCRIYTTNSYTKTPAEGMTIYDITRELGWNP